MKTKSCGTFLNILFLLLLSGNSFSQSENTPKDSIDLVLRDCLDYFTASYDLVGCMDDAADAWDDALNEIYQKLIKTLLPEEQELLRISQRAWIEYRDKEMAFVNQIHAASEGISSSSLEFSKLQRKMELTRSRVLELRGYYGEYYPE
jgi:uncharacterized protein YecT (DUF1311 family)